MVANCVNTTTNQMRTMIDSSLYLSKRKNSQFMLTFMTYNGDIFDVFTFHFSVLFYRLFGTELLMILLVCVSLRVNDTDLSNSK